MAVPAQKRFERLDTFRFQKGFVPQVELKILRAGDVTIPVLIIGARIQQDKFCLRLDEGLKFRIINETVPGRVCSFLRIRPPQGNIFICVPEHFPHGQGWHCDPEKKQERKRKNSGNDVTKKTAWRFQVGLTFCLFHHADSPVLHPKTTWADPVCSHPCHPSSSRRPHSRPRRCPDVCPGSCSRLHRFVRRCRKHK